MSIAFFDVDGTLLPHPSIERRFFWELFRSGKIPSGNCFWWMAEAARLWAANRPSAMWANKRYLRGVPQSVFVDVMVRWLRPGLPKFFPAAIQRVWWHAQRGDAIVLVTGTLAPLAEIVKAGLERELRWRGVEASISVLATKLEFRAGRWTGNIDGSLMLDRAKASAVREFASARGVALARCSAYGDHEMDRWMLASVGNAFAVNPRPKLRPLARHHGWLVMHWDTPTTPAFDARQAFRWKKEAAR